MKHSKHKLTLSQETVRILVEEQIGPQKTALSAGAVCQSGIQCVERDGV